jgi:hypothetical protein
MAPAGAGAAARASAAAGAGAAAAANARTEPPFRAAWEAPQMPQKRKAKPYWDDDVDDPETIIKPEIIKSEHDDEQKLGIKTEPGLDGDHGTLFAPPEAAVKRLRGSGFAGFSSFAPPSHPVRPSQRAPQSNFKFVSFANFAAQPPPSPKTEK